VLPPEHRESPGCSHGEEVNLAETSPLSFHSILNQGVPLPAIEPWFLGWLTELKDALQPILAA